MKKKQNILWAGVLSAVMLLLSIGCAKHENTPTQPANPDLMTQLKGIQVNPSTTNNAAAREIDYHEISHADLVGFIDAFLHGPAGTDPYHEASIASFCEWIAQVLEDEFETAIVGVSGDDTGNSNNSYDNAGITHNAICQMVIMNKNNWLNSNGTVNSEALREQSNAACRIYCNKPLYSIDPNRYTYFSTNFLSGNPTSAQQFGSLLSTAVSQNNLTVTDQSVMTLYLSQIESYSNITDLCNYSIAYENVIVASTDPNLHKDFLLSCFSIVRHSSCLWHNVTISH